MKKIISILLTITLLLTVLCAYAEEPAANTAIRYEGPGFDTPEDAVTCYLNGLKNQDIEQMLSAFAWETQASHYAVDKSLRSIGVYSQSTAVRMPAINDFMVSANLHSLRALTVRMIYNALEAYILGDDCPNGDAVPMKDDADVEVFLKKFDNGQLEKLTEMSEITFLTPDFVTNNRFSSEKNKERLISMTEQYGADELVNVVATALIGKGIILCMPTVARYGDRWYIVSVSSVTSSLLGVDANRQAFIWLGEGLKELNDLFI